MRRAFTLQLEQRPEGRAFTCPTCDMASMHPENVVSVVCPNCSQSGVMKVTAGADIQVGDVLMADHQGNKTPIGYALKDAKAGEIVEVQLGAIDDKDKR